MTKGSIWPTALYDLRLCMTCWSAVTTLHLDRQFNFTPTSNWPTTNPGFSSRFGQKVLIPTSNKATLRNPTPVIFVMQQTSRTRSNPRILKHDSGLRIIKHLVKGSIQAQQHSQHRDDHERGKEMLPGPTSSRLHAVHLLLIHWKFAVLIFTHQVNLCSGIPFMRRTRAAIHRRWG